MIRKIRFSNFYSFYREQEISFLANKKKTDDYYNSESGDQIAKIAAFIGGNASGKTNVMRLFSFLSYFVCRESGRGLSEITNIAYQTFFGNEEVLKIYVEFEIGNIIFFYEFSTEKITFS